MIAFIKRWSTAITATALLLLAVYAFHGQQRFSHETRTLVDRANQETITRQVQGCRTAAEFRRTFPDILRQLAHPPTQLNTRIDFTKVPGFSRLDPAQQSYLIALGAILTKSGGGSSTFLEDTATRYERDFPVPNCSSLKDELEQKLTLQKGNGQ